MPIPLGMIAGQAAQAGMGMLLQNINDRRQVTQQRRLQGLELEGQRQMTDYNMNKQMELWEKTNYAAQVEQMKKAGLNPAMIYGMGGAGGATTDIKTGNVTGGHAPTGGGEIMGLMSGQGLALQAAQIENIKAQTDKTRAEIPKVGAETANLKQNLENMKQQLKTEEQKTLVTQEQAKIEAIKARIAGATEKAEIDRIWNESAESLQSYKQALIKTGVDEGQAQELVKLTAAQVIHTTAQAELAKKGIEVADAQISKWAQDVAVAWAENDVHKRDVKVKEATLEFQKAHPAVGNVIGGTIDNVRQFLEKSPISGAIEKLYQKAKEKGFKGTLEEFKKELK